jgi:uncharacterized protein (DUF1697 family)
MPDIFSKKAKTGVEQKLEQKLEKNWGQNTIYSNISENCVLTPFSSFFSEDGGAK